LLNEKKIVKQVVMPEKIKIKRGPIWIRFD